ncbi:MAG TPA: ABC transporter permease [Chthoniobacterales bacterium]|nr:ABC transporter permease [Chthoniobacterales bacterium]
MRSAGIGWLAVPLAIVAGAFRGGTPFLFVSLGECLTEKSGKINLGLEGVLLFGAMSGYAISYKTGSPWLGVLAAACGGACLGLVHAWLTQKPKVNDIAVGIAMIIFGSGIAFFLGKPFIQPLAPQLPAIRIGLGDHVPPLDICPLFFVGVALAFALNWFFGGTRWGMFVRAVGDKADAARALGISVWWVRTASIIAGSSLAGIGGAYLSLFYPGSWNERVSSGQGMIAVALVIFARWNPIHCLWASLLFGGAQALGPALQSVGVTSYYYLFNASPFILTLAVMILTCSNKHSLSGAPGALADRT